MHWRMAERMLEELVRGIQIALDQRSISWCLSIWGEVTFSVGEGGICRAMREAQCPMFSFDRSPMKWARAHVVELMLSGRTTGSHGAR